MGQKQNRFHKPSIFRAAVISSAALVGAEGSRRLFSGPCNTTVFPWTHDKAGGPPA